MRALAASTASGVGLIVQSVGEYFEGHLLVNRTAAGVGAWIRPIWQTSSDGVTGWADLTKGATMNGVGVGVLAVSNLGGYFRPRWPQGATSITFSIVAVVKE
jgi:hypothetical protein